MSEKSTAQMLCDEHYARLIAESRALKYEQALREIERHCIGADVLLSPSVRGIEAIARAALDKPMEGK